MILDMVKVSGPVTLGLIIVDQNDNIDIVVRQPPTGGRPQDTQILRVSTLNNESCHLALSVALGEWLES